MKEIEVKAQIRNPEQLITKVEELGCKLSDPIEQIDRIFIKIGDQLPAKENMPVLRIRKQGERILLTMKLAQTNSLDCIEHELGIDNEEQMAAIILSLGFFEASHVHKTRRKTKYQDLEICIDEVRDLGSFIEVEKLVEEGDSTVIQNTLFEFLETLGVKHEDRKIYGYDVLVLINKGEIKV